MLKETHAQGYRGKQFLLTWAQCPLPLEMVHNILEQRFGGETEYILSSQEEHKQTGGLHIHAVIVFKERRRLNIEETIIDGGNQRYRPNIEGVRSLKASIMYVKKDGTWKETGKDPVKKQEITKKDKMDFIKQHSFNEIVDSGLFSFSEVRNAHFIKTRLEEIEFKWPAYEKRIIKWYYGPTGSGKTRMAVKEAQESEGNWTMLSGDMRTFINGYTNEENVIFDDVRKGTFRFEQLLRLLDGYRVIINVKGGFREWRAKRIWITCPQEPTMLFRNEETLEPWDNIDQLLRRIDETKEFPVSEIAEQTTEVLSYIPSGGSPGLPPATGTL